MDRIPNRTGLDANYDRILGQIIMDATKVGIDERPPYLYLGSISPLGPAITLDMVRGVRLQNTMGDRFNFAHVESGSVAFQLQKNMVDGFFTLVRCGVVPRDIEYALAIDTVKGTVKGMVKTMIYDFNQCDFAVERRKRAFSVDLYNYSMDLAEIYIDLCGLRHPNDTLGNRLVLDTPTPQWKFLCNPLVSPGSWCEIMEGLLVGGVDTVDIEGFIRYTPEYLIKYYGGGDKGIHMPWKSQSGYFYKGNIPLLQMCDLVIQEILMYPVWKDCHHGKKWKGGLTGKFIDLYSEGCVAISTYTSTYTVEDDWDLGHVFERGLVEGHEGGQERKRRGGEKLVNKWT
jgi:hypothetical protein